MKYPCDLIKDLLPLYHDGVCSADSAAAVEAHLKECASCQASPSDGRKTTGESPRPCGATPFCEREKSPGLRDSRFSS